MADVYSAGAAIVRILPSLRGFRRATEDELGNQFGDGLPLPMKPEVDPDSASRDGAEYGGRFAETARRAIDSALRALPEGEVDVDTGPARARMIELRGQLEALRSRVGVDVSGAEALARIREISAELGRLGGRDADVAVRVDAAAAQAALAGLTREVAQLDGRKVEIGTGGSRARFSALGFTIAALAPALVPIAAVGTAALGALGTGAVIAGGAMGALLLGTSGVGDAVKALAGVQAAATGTAAQQAAAQQKLAQAMANLSPPAQEFARFVYGLKPRLDELRATAAAGLLPGVQAGLSALLPQFGLFNTFIGNVSLGLGNLARSAGQALAGPFWTQFGVFLNTTAIPTLATFGQIAGGTLQGLFGLFQGLYPLFVQMGEGLVGVTSRFADFGAQVAAGQHEGFNRFLAYVAENGPLVWSTLSNLVGALIHIAQAVSPMGPVVLVLVDALARFIQTIPPEVLGPIVMGVLGLYLAFQALTGVAAILGGITGAIQAIRGATWLWAAAQWALNAALSPYFLIPLLIAAVVAAVVWAWFNFEGFRNVVLGAWTAIQTAIAYAWNAILRPVFDGIVTALMWVGSTVSWLAQAAFGALMGALRWLGDAALWLWQVVLVPAFNGISLAVRVLAAVLFTVLVWPWLLWFKLLGAIATWLWANAVVPAFNGIVGAAMWLWTNGILPMVNFVVGAFRFVAATATWLWLGVLVPAFNGITTAAMWLWLNGVMPVVNLIVGGFRFVAAVAMWLWTNVVIPAFNGIGAAVMWVWNTILRPTFDAIMGGVRAVADGFSWAVDRIRDVWGKIVEFTRPPIDFVVNVIYNHGIRPAWNFIAGLIGLGQLPEHRFARGGVVPLRDRGYDYVPALLRGEEGILIPEATRMLGGARGIEALNDRARRGVDRVPRKRGTGAPEPGGTRSGPRGPLWQQMWGIVQRAIPGARLTSAFRRGDPGYHGRGQAVDLGGPLMQINRFLGEQFPGSAEIIYTPGPFNIKNGRPHRYNRAVQLDHYDHVHWATSNPAQLTGSGATGGGLDFSWITDAFKAVTGQIGSMVGRFGDTPWTRAAAGVPGKAIEGLIGKAVETFTAIGNAVVDTANVGLVRAVAMGKGWGLGAEWDALYRLIEKESGFRNTAQNPTSTAYGLFQFLDSTWGTVGGSKTADPIQQTIYGLRYIENKYGSPTRALGFHLRNNWYDEGGWLAPGATLAFNDTGAPEAVFTQAQLRELTRPAPATPDTFTLTGGHVEIVGDGLLRIVDARLAATGTALATGRRA